MVTEKQVQAAAQTILGAVEETPGSSLDERELLRFVLLFANEDKLTGPLQKAPDLRFIRPLNTAAADANWQPTSRDVVPPEEWVTQLRTQLRQDLHAVIAMSVAPQSLSRLKKAAARMVATPQFSIERRLQKALRVKWNYIPTNLESVLSYCVLLLLDDGKGLGMDLKSCSLPECGLFFFSSERTQETGKPRERFCTNEHMHEAHRRTSASRTRKYRERKAREAAKKGGNSR